VEERAIPGAEQRMLGFETLTFAPIDRALIDLDLLDAGERAWIDRYHADVARLIGPQLEGAAAEWLEVVTAAL
jgi:Xaa-Pro aminopeptidase